MAVIMMGGSQFSPLQLPGLQLWFKADAIEGLSDGNAVSSWVDSSGNGRNLSQGTAGFRPTYQTNEKNSLPIVRFDDTDDFMDTATGLELFSGTDDTVFAVVKSAATIEDGDTIWTLLTDAGALMCGSYFVNTAGPLVRSYNNDGVADTASKTGAATNTWYIVTFLHTGGTLYAGLTDTRTSSLGSNTSGTTSDVIDTYFRLGTSAGSFAGMDFAEIIACNQALSEGVRQDVERYLSQKWAITLPY